MCEGETQSDVVEWGSTGAFKFNVWLGWAFLKKQLV